MEKGTTSFLGRQEATPAVGLEWDRSKSGKQFLIEI